MRRRTLVLLALLILHGARSVSADQLLLGLEQMLTGQQNICGLYEDEIADGTYEIRPSVQLRRPEGTLSYDLSYSPTFEVFFRSDQLNGVDHSSRATIQYEVLPVASLSLRADLAHFRSTRASTVDGPTGNPEVVPETAGDINRIFADLEYEHQLSRSTRATGAFSFQRYAFTTLDGADSNGFGARIEAVHEPTQAFGIGGSLAGSLRRFKDRSLPPALQNAVLNPNLVITMSPAQTVFLSLRAGPALLFTRSAGIAGGSSTSDTQVTWFLDGELQKAESWGHMSLALRRDEAASAGSGSTTLRDSITATLFIRSGKRWTGHLFANWSRFRSRVTTL